MKKIFVKNLSYRATESEMRELFGRFGVVDNCEIIKDNSTGASKGLCIVTMSQSVDASRAIMELNNTFAFGRRIFVEEFRGRNSISALVIPSTSFAHASTTEVAMQWRSYKNQSGAHGFAAEDANALDDVLHGQRVAKVGRGNEFCGPDRISDGVAIQTKYCQTARKTVESAFNGDYCYRNQRLEVPKDQYEECVRIMQEKIRAGKVVGVSDPSKARDIVKCGDVTYQQAQNIARAGNVDSLWFDVKTQSVISVAAGGISGAIAFFRAKRNGMSDAEAFKIAGAQSVKSGASALATGVLTQQALRTAAGRTVAAAGMNLVRPVAASAVRSGVSQSTAQGLTRLAGANAVACAAGFVVSTGVDVVDYARGKISGRELAVNTVSNAAGAGGGWAGASAGAAVGSAIFPGVGTVLGGIVGGIAGAISGSSLVRGIFG